MISNFRKSSPSRHHSRSAITLLKIAFFFFSFISSLGVGIPITQADIGVDPYNPVQGKKVLVLCSYEYLRPSYQKINPALYSTLKNGGVATNDIFVEYLDLFYSQDERPLGPLAEVIRLRYAKRDIDLIVTIHLPALRFFENQLINFFPKIPIIAWNLTQVLNGKKLENQILHIATDMDMEGTLERALDIFPDTTNVTVISGTSEVDRLVEAEARRALKNWENKLKIEYLTDSTIEEILAQVANLPRKNIVIYCNVFQDKSGRSFAPSDVAERIAKVASAPIFCLFDTYLEKGMIGGSVLSYEAEGQRVGRIALDVLSSKIRPGKEAAILTGEAIPMFDWQKIKKWGGNTNKLPKGTVFVNLPISLWAKYAWQIISVLAVILAQLILISSLLVQRRRRKRAEDQLRLSNETLEQRVVDRTAELIELNRNLQTTNTLLEKKRLEAALTHKQLLHSEKLSSIGQLSASIAHEFNNPLQSILTILHGLKKTVKLDEQDKVMLDLAISENHRMRDLIRNLQSFNRPSSGKKEFVDLRTTLDSLLILCKSEFKRRNISIILNTPERLPQIEAIPDQIKQVFLNLLNNAADACGKNGGEITVTTRTEGNNVMVAIQDTGMGIAPEIMDKIFQPFFTTKAETKGTGLGLPICHGIIKDHLGEIRVESEPGKGSTFTVILPVDG